MSLMYLINYFILLLSVLRVDALSPEANSADWSGWGGNVYNNRWASQNRDLSTGNIGSLAIHCNITYPVGISATPVLYGDIAYYPTWNGSFVALNYQTCNVLWQVNVTALVYDYAPLTPLQVAVVQPLSRTSPQIDGDVLYFGTQANALVVAVNRSTGKLLATFQTDTHPMAIVTMSPTFYDGRLFVGVSSLEEAAAGLVPGYVCCSFVGSMYALTFDKRKGNFQVLWKIPMIPEVEAARGWAGVGVWGSQPSIDTSRGQVFIATGNVYSVPPIILECQNATADIPAVVQGVVPEPCLPADILQETVLAIDMELGIINWAHTLTPLDAWTLACGGIIGPRIPTVCPGTPGPDADFGMAPSFVPGSPSTPYGKDTVVIGQKNGILYALSAQAGQVFWATVTNPGSVLGGLSWGIAVDDKAVYFTAENSLEAKWQLQPSNETISRSAYGAASLSTGAILWETASPNGGMSVDPPTVVGDLVLVGKTGSDPNGTLATDKTKGNILAINKGNGKIVAEFQLDSAFHGGIAVKDKSVVLGTGYSSNPAGVKSFLVYNLGK